MFEIDLSSWWTSTELYVSNGFHWPIFLAKWSWTIDCSRTITTYTFRTVHSWTIFINSQFDLCCIGSILLFEMRFVLFEKTNFRSQFVVQMLIEHWCQLIRISLDYIQQPEIFNYQNNSNDHSIGQRVYLGNRFLCILLTNHWIMYYLIVFDRYLIESSFDFS